MEIVEAARRMASGRSPWVFRNEHGKQLDNKRLQRTLQKHRIAAVPHGFRSSFRDWAAEENESPPRGDRGGAGACRWEQGRGGIRSLGLVQASPEIDGGLGCVPQCRTRPGRRAPLVTPRLRETPTIGTGR